MKKVSPLLLAALLCVGAARSQKLTDDFNQAHDLTAENMFSKNIEGPNFDKSGNFYVVNFEKDGTIGKINPKDGKGKVFLTLPDSSIANGIHFDSKGLMYLPDFVGHNVLTVDMRTKKVSVYLHNDEFNQPNDLCFMKNDIFFASDPNWKDNTGQIWRIEKGEATLVAKDMGTTNGIELSPDEKTLYVNESIQRKVWKFEVDKKGNLYHKTLFYQFTDGGMDGMKCDKNGNLYICRWGNGEIVVLSPTGKLFNTIQLRGKQCSNLVFGGRDGQTIYVTLQDRKCIETVRVAIPGKKWVKPE
ncbi:gluconolactonase [Chitinophaga costaii]|uniref:Gluconolactonase n=1 Tax=Chitinophaga costaii TaxID=1335309 RepID=A0A1C4AAG7_9BACT|nr:SMP-30/gluconolactonase/LRE family protein [Chitinophaga costaii]PUZ26525.1 gluconolactonase [Chitinophaga costaii]SCB91598.1 gluconolactonase [Chitinophaga costaii]